MPPFIRPFKPRLKSFPDPSKPRILIVGVGFGGLAAAKALARAPAWLTLLDRRNHHLFQPLLYQVATATLSSVEIAAPIRHIFRRQANAEVLLGEVLQVDLEARTLRLAQGQPLAYDFLILATGASHSYFGQERWRRDAPGLKSLEDALEIRRRILLTFEQAERESDPDALQALLTFVIVGAGPTGVELAGTLKEMACRTLPQEFRHILPEQARVILIEAGPRVLPAFGEGLSDKAQRSLEAIGVELRLGQPVRDLDDQGVTVGQERIPARTVLWAAGVAANPLGRCLGVPLDRWGRVLVAPDLSLPGHPEAFVIGDLACFGHGRRAPLPGVAPVAIQQGRCAAHNILASLGQGRRQPFRYRDRGSLATIGRGSAVAQLGRFRFNGLLAWLLWLFIHLLMLVGFQNRLGVLLGWFGAYLSTQRRARLILEPGRPDGPYSTDI